MLAKLWTRRAPQMLGIDFGSQSIKVVLLEQLPYGYQLKSYTSAPLKKGAIVDHVIRDMDAVTHCLKQALQEIPYEYAGAAIAVSGSAVMSKVIFMDASLSEAEMEIQITIEAENLIPYPIEEVNIDFEILRENQNDPAKVDVLLSVCRTEIIDICVDVLESCDVETRIVDVKGYALGKAIRLLQGQLPDDIDNKVVAMVDIGASHTTLSVIEQGETIFVKEQAFGGEQLTQAIASFYGYSFEEAEAAKVEQRLPLNADLEVVQPFQQQIIQQMKRTLQMYCTANSKEKVDYILLCGGGAYLADFAKLVTEEIGVVAAVADPFVAAGIEADDELRGKVKPQVAKLMVACGLALRSFG